MNPLDFLFGDGLKKAANYGLKQLFGNSAVQLPVKKSSGSSGGGGGNVSVSSNAENRPVPYTLQELMRMGYSELEAYGLLASGAGGGYGGGGGGYGGGGGGGGYYIDTAARDAALANAANTYATAAATFDGSVDEYNKISSEEKKTGSDSAANATAGMNQAYKAALESRAAERAALGIEDAASVGVDTVANEKKIASENIERDTARRDTRVQGHLDNNLKFNTDLKAVVELEGKEKQKQITDYYAGQLAQIAARSGGGGGRGYSSGGSSRSSSSKGMTPGQVANFMLGYGKNMYNEQLGQYESRYGMQDKLNIYNQTQGNLPLSKWLGTGLYGRKI